MNPLKSLLPLFALLITSHTMAAEEAPNGQWSGEGELGYVAARGNTETETVTGKLTFGLKTENWTHELGLSALRTIAEDPDTGEEEETADRYQVTGQSNYRFDERRYVFGAFRHEEDQFSGYENQSALTAGYGHAFFDSKELMLKVEIGAGQRWSELDTGEEIEESILRLRGDHAWQIADNARWTNELLVESGEDNTFSEFSTGLKFDLNSKLAFKFAYVVRENSDVPADREKRDTLTTINLVFAF